jgi:hypothetical protein
LIKDYPLELDIPKRAYDFCYFLIKVLRDLKEVFGCLDEREIQASIDKLNETEKNET